MSIGHVKNVTIGDGTNTDVVRPSDWNSNHNMILNIGGNTAGTSQVVGTDIVWAGGNNITLSANGSTISIIGVGPQTISSFVPFEADGLATTNSSALQGTSGQISMWPITVPEYVAVDRINMLFNMSLISSAVSGRQSGGIYLGLYTRGTGASTSLLSQLDSISMGFSVTGSSSSMTLSFATATNSAGYTYTSTTTSNATSNNLFFATGATLKMLQFPIGMTLTPGVYWVGLLGTQSTTSAAIGLGFSVVGVSKALTNMGPMGSNNTAFSTGTNQLINGGMGEWGFGQGVWSQAGGNTLPNSIAISAISNGASVMPLMKFWSLT
jgi:hypothetical protein